MKTHAAPAPGDIAGTADKAGRTALPSQELPGRSDTASPRGERLNHFLARHGIASRRQSDELVKSGRVTVNGLHAVNGTRILPGQDVIAVDGKTVGGPPGTRTLLYHKPVGVTSTIRDSHAAISLAQAVPDLGNLVPVGRLDLDTSGALLLSNDGELAHRVTHPSFGVEKEYRVWVKEISPGAIARMRQGVSLEDGIARPAALHLLRTEENCFDLVMTEGKNREVRRMVAAAGMELLALQRRRIGQVRLGDLAPGRVRELTQRELQSLALLVGLERGQA